MDDPVEFHIPYQKNSMSFPDHVENILTHVEREYLWGRPFTKFQQFDLSIRIIIPHYKNYLIVKAKNCLKIEHNKVNGIPF